jgi:hypothetical protein
MRERNVGFLSLLSRSNGYDRVAAPALLLGLLLSENVAEAQSGDPPGTATIVVTFDPSAVEQKPAIAAVKAHVSGLPVRVVVEPAERNQMLADRLARSGALALARGALGTFSIELGPRGELLVFFTEPDGNATLIRRLPGNQEGIQVAIEQAAIVVRSLVEALLEGRRIGMTQEAEAESAASPQGAAPPAEEPPSGASSRLPSADGQKPSPEPAPLSRDEQERRDDEAPARPRRKIAVSASYQGSDFSANTPWESGLALGVRWLALPVAYGALRYTFFPSMEVGSDAARVSVTRHPFEVVAGYTASAILAPSAELGVQVDYTRRETLSTGADYRATSSAARFVLALGARVGMTWAASSVLEATLRGGADFLLTRYSYVVSGSPAPISPSTVRPKLELELAFGVW